MFDQLVPHGAKSRGFQPGGFGFARDIVEHFGLAGFVANGGSVGLDARRGVHIAETADKQRDERAIDLVDPGADIDHGFAIFRKFGFGKFGGRHARCL